MPGLISDVLGLFLLLPPVRKLVARSVLLRLVQEHVDGGAGEVAAEDVVAQGLVVHHEPPRQVQEDGTFAHAPELRLAGWPLGMAVKADSSQLAEALSGALADLQRSGELTRIFAANGVRHRVP